ncbi:MAG: 1-deoxy-D-xylulose-5-phosphate reductoisomerase [Firmicutes bacterium]|nr:1-deoxy-D-xylulose-5-phosphate reductoisomerase [Bacillota bacterium]
MKRLAIVGASGSIGRQTLEVARLHADRLRVVAAAAQADDAFLAEVAEALSLEAVALDDEAAAERLAARLARQAPRTRVFAGSEGVRRIAAWPAADMTVSAAWGAAGLDATLAALEAGKDVALANKESLVAGGELVMRAARRTGARILPVDSEHSAAFQLLAGREDELRRLWITASGGPFRGWTVEAMRRAAPEDALRHPTWRMGARITVDSATLFNKGLEVIEAHWLFGLDYDDIAVVVHPQSVVHALLELRDGSFLAHAGPPDMRLPIQHALSHPERWAPPVAPLPPDKWGILSFEAPDLEAFPALRLAYAAGRAGGTAPAVLNAAKEEAVLAFLDRRLAFTDIAACVAHVLAEHETGPAGTLEAVRRADAWARERARVWIAARGPGAPGDGM